MELERRMEGEIPAIEVAIEKCDVIIAALMKSATTAFPDMIYRSESFTDEKVCDLVDDIYEDLKNKNLKTGYGKSEIARLSIYVLMENLRHDLRRRYFTMSYQLPEDLVEIKG